MHIAGKVKADEAESQENLNGNFQLFQSQITMSDKEEKIGL